MKYTLKDLIDVQQFQMLQDRLNDIYTFPSAIIDNDGNILTASAWQDVCTKFHRANKECEKECIKSDQYIKDHLSEANPAVSYRCPHGLVDNATPIVIEGIHYGNFFTGQFFLEKPNLDFFRAQAKQYGFDENEYIEAVKKVPIWTQEQLKSYLFFIKGLIEVISGMGLKNLKEIETRKKILEDDERYRTLLQTAMDGFWLTDVNGKLLQVNEAYCRMSGYTMLELLSMRISDVECKETRVATVDHIKKVIDQGEDRFESKHRRKDGSIFNVEVSVQYRQIEGGRLVVFLQDITERKRVENKLKENEQFLSDIIENNGALIYVKDREGRYELVNKKFEESTGYHREMLIGKTDIEMFPGDTGKNFRTHDIEVMELGVVEEKEEQLENATGNNYYLSIKFPLWDNNNTVKGICGISTDITERKRAEDNLKQSESKYRTLIENTGTGYLIIDSNGAVIDANEEYVRLSGHNELREILGKNVLEWTAEYEKQRNAEAVARCAKDGFIRNLVLDYVDGAGRITPVEISATVEGEGEETRILTICSNITERKLAEHALIESEDRFKYMFEYSTIGNSITYFNGKINVNKALCDMLGYSHQEMQEKKWQEITYPDDIELTQNHIDAISSGKKKSVRFEKRFVHKNGSIIWVDLSSSLRCDQQNKPLYLMSSMIDITEQKHAKEKLHESEGQYRSLFEHASDLILILELFPDEQPVIRDANNKALQSFGYSREELLGKTTSFVEPELSLETAQTRAHIVQARQRGGNEKQTPDFEIRHKRKDGSFFDTEVRAQEMMIGGKHLSIVIERDVTEQKRAQNALKLSEEKYVKLFSSNPSAITLTRISDGMLMEVNESFTNIFGYSRDEVIGSTVFQKGLWVDLHEREKLLVELMKKDSLLRNIEVRFYSKDKKIITASGSWETLEFGGEEYSLATFVDISERKQMEQALRNAQKLESIGTLAGGIAHDFNNLLNAIMGQSSLALKKIPEENPAIGNINKAIKASEHAADLTKQLLAYSGRGKFLMERIDLNLLVRENISILEVSVAKNAELRYELCTPAPCIIADSGQIQQIIMNLIINASDAMETKPGVITVRTNSIELAHDDNKYCEYTHHPLLPGRYALLQVSDTGSGMSQETLTRIFDPFFTTKFTGRGLGLSAVLGIIKGHKGGMRIESTVGTGTQFEVVLPLVDTSQIMNVPEKEKSLVLAGEGKTILIIDDDPFVFQLLEDIFTEYHFTVIGSSDPVQGIEYYRQEFQNVSMVILDFSMPHMNGKDVFEQLIQINKNVKVLLCSGYTEEETLLHFEKERPMGFFQKPYKPETLAQRVMEIVSNDL